MNLSGFQAAWQVLSDSEKPVQTMKEVTGVFIKMMISMWQEMEKLIILS